jgi:hypothetical protein
MTSAVCTLFEGDYHYGVGALVNSLYASGYRGVVYAGHRGGLPPWAGRAVHDGAGRRLDVAEGVAIVFVPLETERHLTNCKGQFMSDVLARLAPTADAVLYFDPDIVTRCPWLFFEQWLDAGVAICEDVNSSMAPNHPIRRAWVDFLQGQGMRVERALGVYYNAGFLGVTRKRAGFLKTWQSILEALAPRANHLRTLHVGARVFAFNIPDQDALNMTAMVTTEELSPVGPDGMDFQAGGGGFIMSHAIGGRKPWRRRYTREALVDGIGPSRADRAYWRHVTEPIRLFPGPARWWRGIDLGGGVLLSRIL